jgi:hypothetical protein
MACICFIGTPYKIIGRKSGKRSAAFLGNATVIDQCSVAGIVQRVYYEVAGWYGNRNNGMGDRQPQSKQILTDLRDWLTRLLHDRLPISLQYERDADGCSRALKRGLDVVCADRV